MESKLKHYSLILCVAMMMGMPFALVAQVTKTIQGHVVGSKSGRPIAGASIKEVGGKNASSTNENGDFTLSVASNKVVLSIQYVGYIAKNMEGTVGIPLRVELQEDNTVLDEVVVVAYGATKKKDLTGSVSTIDNKA